MSPVFTRTLMAVSAVAMVLAGLACTFAPEELLGSTRVSSAPDLPLFVQILGALYLGFGILNWYSRGAPLGGIYGRPLVLANLLHFVSGGLAIIPTAFKTDAQSGIWIVLAFYASFGVGFGILFFKNPRQ